MKPGPVVAVAARKENMDQAGLNKILDSHARYLAGDPTGVRADLRGADFYGAELGATSSLGKDLRLLGACMDACSWVDRHHEFGSAWLLEHARPDWREWLRGRLGGEPSPERLAHVIAFVTVGYK